MVRLLDHLVGNCKYPRWDSKAERVCSFRLIASSNSVGCRAAKSEGLYHYSFRIGLVAVEYVSVPVESSDSLRGGAERGAVQYPAILAAHVVSGHFQDSECREREGRLMRGQLDDTPVGIHGERIAGLAALARIVECAARLSVCRPDERHNSEGREGLAHLTNPLCLVPLMCRSYHQMQAPEPFRARAGQHRALNNLFRSGPSGHGYTSPKVRVIELAAKR
jgi:hypothetical protein